jgi:hypothetical protein
MSFSRTDELMHLVLDGEATPAESRELEQRLSTDASARTRFDELRYLFDGLSQVPQAFPPEGLIASVLANIPQNRRHFIPGDQLFAAPGVLEASSRKARGKGPGRNKWIGQILQPWAFSRGNEMNEQKRGLANSRKIWIGGGIAVAAAVVAVSTGLLPPNAADTAGTIVPASRYHGPQAQEVNLGTTSPTATTSGASNATISGIPGGQANGQLNGQLNGQSNGQLNGQSNGQLNGQLNGPSNGQLNGQLNGQSNGQLNGQLNGQSNGQLNGQSNGQLNGQLNGQSKLQI